MKNNEIKRLSLNVDARLWENFKKLCKKNDTDASKELRKYIREYVNNNRDLLDRLF